MSTLHPHAVIPKLIIFTGIIVSGVIVSATESPAAARERYCAGAAAICRHAHDMRVIPAAEHRITRGLAHQTGRRAVRRDLHQIAGADRAEHHEVVHESGHSFSGLASYYSESQSVASGGAFDASGYTCAHPTLPFGTQLRVADPKSGRSVVVTVNDRGPFVRGRALDLSLGAARALGMIGHGVMHVEAQVI
jgi:rare lipoprotein A (peptidoglycan hydrolase)